VVGVSGPEACPTPDLTNIICLPEAFDLIPPPTLGTNDYVFTLSQRCAIVKQAFLVINFSDTVAGCRDSLRRPRLGVSDSECVFCKSYNDFTGPSGLDGIPDDLCGQLGTEANPIMYVEVDSCFDVQPPDPVLDLAAVSTSETSVSLRWTATGDDGRVGRPLRYLIAASTQPVDEVSFDAALKDSVPASVGADSTESFTLGGLAGARTYWIALKARDDAGKLSALSNLTSARTQVGGPLTGRVGPAIAMITQPTRLPVEFFWQGTGEASVGRQLIRIYDVAGRLRRTLDVGGEVNGIEPWDGKDDQGETVQSGVYIARLDSGLRQVRTRVVLVR